MCMLDCFLLFYLYFLSYLLSYSFFLLFLFHLMYMYNIGKCVFFSISIWLKRSILDCFLPFHCHSRRAATATTAPHCAQTSAMETMSAACEKCWESWRWKGYIPRLCCYFPYAPLFHIISSTDFSSFSTGLGLVACCSWLFLVEWSFLLRL